MADYLDFFQEHFADQDSEFSDSDFEGFEEEDIVEREEEEEEDPFENWIDGDGQKEILNFSGRKGLLVEMDVESNAHGLF
ncbi:hypothetical protein DPMN_099028 [Dreissena polymorpha]|uniref:Uncharacterized protein n=1 Tax=Dreissena polymorpha TaxID=45954 RepID=A0A9D4R7U2_DREPO|nr:hypothetical protein DPMN_099028 [Dreissena polymorpha]